MHGKGKMVYANGDEYIGEYEWGMICGEGCYKYKKKGHVAEGTWKEGVLHGSDCKYSYKSGAVYYGAFDHGMMVRLLLLTAVLLPSFLPLRHLSHYSLLIYTKHGMGQMNLATGERYEGSFEFGMMCGRGRFTEVDGSVFVGEFKGAIIVV